MATEFFFKKTFTTKNQERKNKLSMFSMLIRCLVWSFTFFQKKKNLKNLLFWFVVFFKVFEGFGMALFFLFFHFPIL